MDIDRHTIPMPVDQTGSADCLRAYHLLPIAGGRDIVELEELVVLDQLFILAAGVELCRAGRIAAENTLHDRRPGRLAERDGAIDPVVLSVGVESLGELRHRRRLAFRR